MMLLERGMTSDEMDDAPPGPREIWNDPTMILESSPHTGGEVERWTEPSSCRT